MLSANEAPMLVLALMLNAQLPVPAQAPLQPLKVEPEAGVAVMLTLVPWLNVDEHVLPQLMPAGVDVTVPAPVPVFVTVAA